MKAAVRLWHVAIVLWLAGLAGFFALLGLGYDDAAVVSLIVSLACAALAVASRYGGKEIGRMLLWIVPLGLAAGLLLRAVDLPSWADTALALLVAAVVGRLVTRRDSAEADADSPEAPTGIEPV